MEKTLQIAQEKIKQLEKVNSDLETLVDQLQRLQRRIGFENENIESIDCPLQENLSPSFIEKTWSIIIPRLTFAEQLQLLETNKQLKKMCLDDVVHKFRVHLQRLNDDNTL